MCVVFRTKSGELPLQHTALPKPAALQGDVRTVTRRNIVIQRADLAANAKKTVDECLSKLREGCDGSTDVQTVCVMLQDLIGIEAKCQDCPFVDATLTVEG